MRFRGVPAFFALALWFFFLSIPQVYAGTNQSLIYQGRIVRPDQTVLNTGTVAFTLSVYSPAPAKCLLYSETQTIDMTGSLGMFSLNLGAGTRTDGGSHTFNDVFVNGKTLSGLTCASGTAYTGAATEDRTMEVSFNDAGTIVNLSSMAIKSVPFALQAHEVDGWGLNNLVKVSATGSPTTFTTAEMANAKLLTAPGPCNVNEILKWNGSAWGCSSDATGGSPSDASYLAKGVFQADTDAATSGLVFSSGGVLKVNYGTAANQIIKLDASSKLPAVDGSALTNLNASNISSGTIPITRGGTGASTKTSAFDALSPNSAKGDITVYNGTNNISLPRGSDGQVLTTDSAQASGLKWANAAATGVTSLTAGTGLTGGTITSTGTLAVDVGTGANQIVQLTAASKLPAIDGSALTNLSANNIASGTLPISKGGTGNSSFAGHAVIVSDLTGSQLQALNCSSGAVITFDSSGYAVCGSGGSSGFLNGGNSFAAAAILGTNDNNTLSFETVGTTRATIDTSGNFNLVTGSIQFRSGSNLIYSSNNLTDAASVLAGSAPSGPTDIYGRLSDGRTLFGKYQDSSGGFSGIWTDNAYDSFFGFTYDWINPMNAGNGTSGVKAHDDSVEIWATGVPNTYFNYGISTHKAWGQVPIISFDRRNGAYPSTTFPSVGDEIGRLDFSGAEIRGYRQAGAGSPVGLPASMEFWTLQNGAVMSRRMTIDSTGNVGIGTGSPGSKLDVSGAIRLSGATSGYAGFQPAANAGSTVWTLPTVDGSSGQFLKTDGSGNLSWGSATAAAITSLNGLTVATQTFAIGTSGNSPNFSSVTATHTLNIPMANTASVTAGLISNTEYDAFNTKLGTSTSFSGDVSGAYNATSVDKIKGAPLSISALSSGNFLKYNGSAWVNAGIAATDITSGTLPVNRGGTGVVSLTANRLLASDGSGSALQVVAPCSQYQVLSFDGSGNYGCYNISSLAGFINNGNSFGVATTLGTNDNQDLNFETYGTTRMTIDTVGKVGIGTTSPAMTLDTRTTSSSTAASTIYNAGSLLTASPASASSSKFQASTIQMDFASGATSSPSAQIYGLNATANNNSAGSVAMSDAIWASAVNNSTGTIGTAHGISASVSNSSSGVVTDGYAVYSTIYNATGTITNGYGVFVDTINATNKWSVYASDSTAPSYFAGKVGIGINAPTDNLHVIGNARVDGQVIVDAESNPTTSRVLITQNNIQNNGAPDLALAGKQNYTYLLNTDDLGIISFREGTNFEVGAQIKGVATENHSATANGTQLEFFTTPNTTIGIQQRMVIRPNGWVGVNESTPLTFFQIGPSADSTTPEQLFLGGYSTAGSGRPTLLGNWASNGRWGIGGATGAMDDTLRIGYISGFNSDWDSNQGNFTLVSKNIFAEGKMSVGLAPSSSSYAFHAQDSQANSWVANINNTNTGASAGGLRIQINAANPGSSNDYVSFYKGTGAGTVIGHIAGNTGSNVQYLTTSDRRLKENIRDTHYSLNDLMKIKVRDYNYIDSSINTTGFIAQDLYEIYPDAVNKPLDESKGTWGVDYGLVTPLIVKSVQDLHGMCKMSEKQIQSIQEKVAAHERRLASVEEENKSLKKENQDLRRRLDLIEKRLGLVSPKK